MKKTMAILFACLLLGGSLAGLLLPDRGFSPRERRNLAKLPKWSLNALFSGEFTKKFESYAQDQFPLRDVLISVKGTAEELLQKKENNGLYFGKDGYLLDGLADFSREKWQENLSYIRRFGENFHGKTVFLPVPTSAGAYPEKLPAFAPVTQQDALIGEAEKLCGSRVETADALPSLREGGEGLYFRLDHHMTMEGAFVLYQKAGEAMGFDPLPRDAFTAKTVSRNFYGTYYAKAGRLTDTPDSIDILLPREEFSAAMTIQDTGETIPGLYSQKQLKGYDPYAVFLGGNHARVTIRTGAGNGRKLLVIKDSYAHTLVPLLAHHYEVIEMIDPRYYRQDLYAFAEEQEIDEALLVFGLANLDQETGLSTLYLGSEK